MNLDSGARIGTEVVSLGGHHEVENFTEGDVGVIGGELCVATTADSCFTLRS